jgi:TPR repeat protein
MRTLLIAFALVFFSTVTARAQAPDPALVARAEAGDPGAALDAAIAFLDAQDRATAERFALMSAEAGNAEAMNLMSGLLRETDPVAARQWEDRAVAAGSEGAKITRGARAILTASSEADWNSGFALVQSVDQTSAAPILDSVASAYERVFGATPERIFQLTRLAAEAGAHPAQWRYAMLLREGRGAPLDLPAAYHWAHRSAEGGYIDGMISTAVMLATAEGVEENDVEAREWYLRAADRGSAHALRGLGFMHLNGEGGAQDVPRGWAYISIAAERGDETAQRYAPQLEPQIPDDLKREAELIRASWLTAHPAL